MGMNNWTKDKHFCCHKYFSFWPNFKKRTFSMLFFCSSFVKEQRLRSDPASGRLHSTNILIQAAGRLQHKNNRTFAQANKVRYKKLITFLIYENVSKRWTVRMYTITGRDRFFIIYISTVKLRGIYNFVIINTGTNDKQTKQKVCVKFFNTTFFFIVEYINIIIEGCLPLFAKQSINKVRDLGAA